MKNIRLILVSFLLIAFMGCEEDERSTDFVDNAEAPSEVLLQFRTTQDNSGVVTITPEGVGATKFDVRFGDGTGNSVNLDPGQSVDNVYTEGTYTVGVTATSINGLTTEAEQQLMVSFQAPQNLLVTIENDVAISKQVNVSATADFAMSYDVYFGEPGTDTPVSGNIGEGVSYTYQDAGTYTITVVAMGSAIETTTYTEDFEVTAILAPLESVTTPPSRSDEDVISIFSDAYTNIENTDFNPNWGQATIYTAFDLNGDNMLQYTNLNYQGTNIGESVDASSMETLHIDIWTPDATSIDIYPLPNGVQPEDERFVTKTLVPNQWNSFEIPMEDFTSQGLPINDLLQFKYVGSGTVFIDNLYFWKTPSAPSSLIGTWKLAPEDGALSVGPGDGSTWWYLNQFGDDVTTRACFMDDQYIFNADGSFQNVVGAETWLEPWQGVDPEACGIPIAPHDGSNPATYVDSGSTITLNGSGAYLGLAKVHNAGEDGMPAGDTITYDYVLSADNNTLEITISGFNGGAEVWYYKLIRETVEVSPLVGTWQIAPEDGALSVGPGDGSTWWYLNQFGDDVTTRACFMDDQYIFNADGSFQNVLGAETWLEPWQGVDPEACGVPVAPHDGSSPATFTEDGSTVTLNGSGAFLGLAKVHNTGEDGMPAGDTITYDYVLSADGNTLEITISGFNGGSEVWYYKLIKQ